MRRFRYRFQRILELKESLEESRRAALGQAVLAAQQVRDHLTTLDDARLDNARQAPKGPGPEFDLGLLRLATHFGLRLEREIQSGAEDLRQVETVVEERRGELVQARRDRRVYEILKEKSAEAHHREERRQERIWLDEVGQQLHRRRGIEQVEAGGR
ncbi:MAG: flagellar export protein FliJ [Gemmatimonadota bacterium]